MIAATIDIESQLLSNVFLSEYTTLGIGGPALYFLPVRTLEQWQGALAFCRQRQLPCLVLGKGSNCLFDDRGFNGLVLLNKMEGLRRDGAFIDVESGYSFSLLGTQTARWGLSGLEFASGIPGTVGGAVYMNAGANGRETAASLASVRWLTPEGELVESLRSELEFSYRHSPFQTKGGYIVGATFELSLSQEARRCQLQILEQRKKSQPLKDKSAGCIFRNPHCGSAGALIDEAALKGMKVGDVEVSLVHANFLVNKGKGTAAQMLQLIEQVRERVKQTYGVCLETEICYIPYDGDSNALWRKL
jgi:UDP-N-acetylmuramate dehydrogenase